MQVEPIPRCALATTAAHVFVFAEWEWLLWEWLPGREILVGRVLPMVMRSTFAAEPRSIVIDVGAAAAAAIAVMMVAIARRHLVGVGISKRDQSEQHLARRRGLQGKGPIREQHLARQRGSQ